MVIKTDSTSRKTTSTPVNDDCEWRHIDTAPKTNALVWLHSKYYGVIHGTYDNGYWKWGGFAIDDLTHWKPVTPPAAPKEFQKRK